MRSRFCLMLLLLVSFYSKSGDDFCNYFPEPAQSWITTGSSDYSSYPSSELTMNNGRSGQNIVGWTEGYVDANYIKNGYTDSEYGTIDVLKVGFDQTSDNSNLHASGTCDTAPCDTGGVGVDSRKIAAPPLLNASFPPDGSADVNITPPYNSGGGYEMCDTSDLCTRITNSNGTTVTIDKDISKLSVASTNGEHYTIIIGGKHTIKTLDVNSNNVEVIFKADSITTINTASFTQSPSITFEDNVRINIQTSWIFNNSIGFSYAEGAESSLLYGPEATITISNPNMDYNGYILAKNLILSNSITIYGAVSANKLQMSTSGTHIISAGKCFEPKPNPQNYFLDVTPDNQFSLLCQTPKVTYTVYNEDGSVATDYNGTITASYPSGLTALEPTVGSENSDYIYKTNQGVVTVPVKSDALAEYTVKAELTDDSAQNDSGLLNFVPFAFGIDEQKVIANKPKSVTVTALACNNNNKEVVIDYSGKPTVTSNLSEPIGGVGELAFAPTLSKGLSTSNLSFSDSGKLTVKLEDDNFDCTGLKDCPIGDDGEADGKLQGSFDVYSRPWTFAICPEVDDTKMNGDITDASSVAFTSAGTDFNLKIKPLRWVNGAADSDPVSGLDEVDVTNYCDQDPTQNFVSNLSPKATMQLTHDVAEPNPSIADKGLLGGVTNQLSTEPTNSYFYSFAGISWSEVGVLKMQADLMANYYDMHVNLGYRNIGRFYPHHLAQTENTWTYAAGHNGFAYMNQPIYISFTIEAQNESNQPTKNYGLFDESLQNKIGLVAVQIDKMGNETIDLSNRLDYSPDTDSGWSDNTVFGSIGFRNAQFIATASDFNFLKNFTNESPYTTVPDGPYSESNAKFGAYVSDMKDGVDFDYDSGTEIGSDSNVGVNHGLSFNTQPDFRYGRMTLDSVSGPIGGPISVPLRVEYWDGSSFITNPDDSGSQFTPSVYYVMSNIASSSAKLTGSETIVSNGKSSVLKAEQANSQRETVRLFLRQGNDSGGYGNSARPEDDPDLNATIKGWINPEDIGQPWLQFNWRNLGDEDPSTVVIFGAYRGNDRIIYRGEPNLTAN